MVPQGLGLKMDDGQELPQPPAAIAACIIEMDELLPEIMSNIACNLFTSDMWNLIRTCQTFGSVGPMAATEKILCTRAAVDIVAAGPSKMKDEAFEYLACAFVSHV